MNIKNEYKKNNLWKLLLFLLCFVVIAISSYFTVNTHDAVNRDSFIKGLTLPLKNPEAVAAACFLAVYTIGLLLKSRPTIISSLFPLLLYALFMLFTDYSVSAGASFASRTLSVTLLPVLIVGAIMVWYCKRELDRTALLTFVAFVIVMVIGNFYNTNNWKSFRHEVIQLVKTHKGYIPIEETRLKDNRYRWGWNNTQLGLVWSAPRVKAIILNEQNLRYEPFNPREKLILKNYLQYDDFFIPKGEEGR
jgi:cytochrome c biogenesis factor